MPNGSTRLIVNADDLGRTRGINDGIFEAHRSGLVTSATLMVAFPDAEHAASRLAGFPHLGIGLHVALTGGVPVLPVDRVASLVDENGRLPAKPEGLAGADPEEIRAEAFAQLERFQRIVGRLPTHLDSHHHSHRLPAVCDALVSLAAEIDRPVRNASPEVGDRLRRAGVITTDAFVERFFGPEATREVLLEILHDLQPGVTEVMCHPARIDEELHADSSYVDDRERELAVLTDSEVLAAVRAAGIQTIHFGEL